MSHLRKTLANLSSAEDFLKFLNIDYEETVVHINRLHILKRFHDYLKREKNTEDLDDQSLKTLYVKLLSQAYQDFVVSDAVSEKVFKVFHQAIGVSHVSLEKVAVSAPKAR
ncbi:nitrogenase-stabilizing/protective protein NifW [Acidithiobacillus ferrianus]|uniref:Nitrogenase-stabilizing/protective protein NifW n=2 Tax=Acidithiobacillus ferrianus TaxID=2678518 RepID=A0A845U982_9PROT|nr:nitrogenase-stabilizing/protective protein NifW [Acidithiobacillus ferrianus]NDU42431.1 nitrogen fixation protein NifW [Acidithiobacillus ferrianus]